MGWDGMTVRGGLRLGLGGGDRARWAAAACELERRDLLAAYHVPG